MMSDVFDRSVHHAVCGNSDDPGPAAGRMHGRAWRLWHQLCVLFLLPANGSLCAVAAALSRASASLQAASPAAPPRLAPAASPVLSAGMSGRGRGGILWTFGIVLLTFPLLTGCGPYFYPEPDYRATYRMLQWRDNQSDIFGPVRDVRRDDPFKRDDDWWRRRRPPRRR